MAPFWQTKSLTEMNSEEWELLCDGCGQCCLVKLEDEESGDIFATSVACRQLDIESCRCKDYKHREQLISSCMVLTPTAPELFRLLPDTCAYRCIADGRQLPESHPLLTLSEQTIHQAGISVKGFAISEDFIHPEQLQEHILYRLGSRDK